LGTIQANNATSTESQPSEGCLRINSVLHRQTRYFKSQGLPSSLERLTGGLFLHDNNVFLWAWNPWEAAFDWNGASKYNDGAAMNEALVSPSRSGDIDVELARSFQHYEVAASFIESLMHLGLAGIVKLELPDDRPRGLRRKRGIEFPGGVRLYRA
jgi:hypothetical protein